MALLSEVPSKARLPCRGEIQPSAPFHIFLSVVLVLRNRSQALESLLSAVTASIAPLVSEYELIVVDNASEDDSVTILKRLTGEKGLPNLQVYALAREVELDTAAWVGIENALGDFTVVIEPLNDDIGFLPTMLEHALRGNDLVFARNERKPKLGLIFRACFHAFNALYKHSIGIPLSEGDSPEYRVVSKRVVNFILRYPVPFLAYRRLAATAGFTRVSLTYATSLRFGSRQTLREALDKGVRQLVSNTRGPMRLVTSLSLLGAVSNLVYSAYVIALGFLKANVQPGWVTVSLQQSGMFFLLSIVLFVLGEYILQMARLTNEGPIYHVAQEFTSVPNMRSNPLNIEESACLIERPSPDRASRSLPME